MQSDKKAKYREAQAMQHAALRTQPSEADNTRTPYPLNADVVNEVTQATPTVTELAPAHPARAQGKELTRCLLTKFNGQTKCKRRGSRITIQEEDLKG